MSQRVTVLKFESDSIEEFSFESTISAYVLSGLSIDFTQIDLS